MISESETLLGEHLQGEHLQERFVNTVSESITHMLV